MANLTTPAPVEPEKSGAYLHDRTRIPEAPPQSRADMVRRWLPIVLGVALALGVSAMMIEARAAWHTHRDWVPAATLPPLIFAGVALGHLFGRNKSESAALGVLFFVLAGVVIVFNILRGYETDGNDALRDFMSILTGVFLALGTGFSVAGFFTTEMKDPSRAPEPQM